MYHHHSYSCILSTERVHLDHYASLAVPTYGLITTTLWCPVRPDHHPSRLFPTNSSQRNQNPAALLRDRHSRSGQVKNTEQLRKHGAGAHNWGSFRQEGEHEVAAGADAMFEMEDDVTLAPLPTLSTQDRVGIEGMGGSGVGVETGGDGQSESLSSVESSTSASASTLMDQEAVGNGGGHGQSGGLGGRRMSGVSEEERESARTYREGIMNKGGEARISLSSSLLFLKRGFDPT